MVELLDMAGAGVSPGKDMVIGRESNYWGEFFRVFGEAEGGKIGGDVDVTVRREGTFPHSNR